MWYKATLEQLGLLEEQVWQALKGHRVNLVRLALQAPLVLWVKQECRDQRDLSAHKVPGEIRDRKVNREVPVQQGVKVLPGHKELLVKQALPAKLAIQEVWVLKGSLVHLVGPVPWVVLEVLEVQANRGSPDHRVLVVLSGPKVCNHIRADILMFYFNIFTIKTTWQGLSKIIVQKIQE